jgi:uncharacterized membrane protein YgcG
MKKAKKRLVVMIIMLGFTVAFAYVNSTHEALAEKSDLMTAENLSTNPEYSGYAYLIDRYDVDVSVNENNTMDIMESIDAYFNISKHGIIRTIPLKNYILRLDGTTATNRAIVDNIRVNEQFSTSVSDGNKVIKIGNPDVTLTGTKTYKIDYSYNLGKDTGKEYDELYLNLIGDKWDTAIGNVTFRITMPKAFEPEMIGFSKGQLGSTDSTGISYQVNGTVITGSYDGVLNPGEALTIRVQLPEGYFINTGIPVDFMTILALAISILFVLITVFLWAKFGNDDHVVETVEFYPPEGFNSAELGYLYKGNAETKDVISLLIYLANKGYIKITEFEEHSLFAKSQTFKLTKLKEYDGDNENERIFLSGLFNVPKALHLADIVSMFKTKEQPPTDDLRESRDEVMSEDLTNSFYITTNKILQNLNKKENKYTIFEKTSLGKGLYFIGMLFTIYAFITIPPVVAYGGLPSLLFGLLFPGIGFTVLFAMVFGKTKVAVKIFGLVWGLGFGGVPWATMVLPALLVTPLSLVAYAVGLVCVFIIVMFFKAMPKRTAYGNEILGKIKGFRTFLETAEKPKLERLVMQDPSYFYNILPYAYVLDVSDKWIEQFETIGLQSPDWYDGSTAFNVASFGTFMNSTMATASTAMSSGSSGGSSGGGSSGGGSGGGGGGSW